MSSESAHTDDSGRVIEKLERQLAEIEKANRKLEQKFAEQTTELTCRNQQLAASNAELQAFAYTAAHDLRAPLRAIQGFAKFLGDELANPSASTARGHLERIKRSSAQMDKLIQDLLDYSKVASVHVRLLPIKLNRVVPQVIASRRADIDEKNGTVEVSVDEVEVMGAEVLLMQALENLLGNALKFVAPKVKPVVTIRAETEGGVARLWVEDNGIGIPGQYQERIFQVFERLHQQDAYPGTGIGLAIVRKAVERMGGKIHVQSEVGHGSIFCLELKQAG